MISMGIDEVGRGCWAGPLVAGAVILHEDVPGLNDSKKLSKKRRDELDLLIRENASVGLGWVTPVEVDELGLTEAVRMAMQRAVDELAVQYDEVIIDGNYNYLPHLAGSRAVIKADGTIPAVSAASIVAKVARDTYMEQLEEKYLPWQFDRHVGYGTALHIEALKAHGISDIHRISYKPIKLYL
jgi:ribonuclease HII